MGLFRPSRAQKDQFAREIQSREAEASSIGQAIQQDELSPINIDLRLDDGEIAYGQFDARYREEVEKTSTHTSGAVKTKGAFGRAVLGGAVFGAAGAVVGAVSAPQQMSTRTYQGATEYEDEEVDRGTLIFTNKRFIFVGSKISSISQDEILRVDFRKGTRLSDMRDPDRYIDMIILFEDMPRGAYFILDRGKAAMLTYKGLMQIIQR